jgi:hypothetical protein
MKSKLLILLVVASVLALSGCDDKAREFAAQTLKILEHRSSDLAGKIAAEKAAYSQSAIHAAEDQRALSDSTLQNERNERSSVLAAEYDEGDKPVSRWRQDLADYGQVDDDTNMKLFSSDLDESSQYLQVFENLKIEQDKVDALTKLLGTLAEKQSLKAEVEAVGKFAEDSKTEFDKKVCTQIKTDQQSTDPKIKAAADAAAKAKKC